YHEFFEDRFLIRPILFLLSFSWEKGGRICFRRLTQRTMDRLPLGAVDRFESAVRFGIAQDGQV
ncbi:MAG: hypothetical protein ACK54R_03390, partial [Pirellulaceae bacterium]